MWIDDLLMLTCGWVAGVITTLAIRHMLDDERRPLDSTLLPAPAIPIPTARGKNARASGAPQLSPYAPRPDVLRTHEKHKLATSKKSLTNPLVQHAKSVLRDFRDCVG